MCLHCAIHCTVLLIVLRCLGAAGVPRNASNLQEKYPLPPPSPHPPLPHPQSSSIPSHSRHLLLLIIAAPSRTKPDNIPLHTAISTSRNPMAIGLLVLWTQDTLLLTRVMFLPTQALILPLLLPDTTAWRRDLEKPSSPFHKMVMIWVTYKEAIVHSLSPDSKAIISACTKMVQQDS